MASDTKTRIPKQKRSIITNQKIIDTAFALFCEKGYYNTTTNEIAKVAGVSIGSFYSYYKDKDTIFMKIIQNYNEMFLEVINKIEVDMKICSIDKKQWLNELIQNMIKIHSSSKLLNKEIKIVSYFKPEVAQISKKHRAIIINIILNYLILYSSNIDNDNLKAKAIIAYNIISSTIDYIVFEESTIDCNDLINTIIDLLYNLLFN